MAQDETILKDESPVETTTDASSSENKNTEDTTTEVKADAGVKSDKQVPYDRFSEVNERARKSEAERDQLRREVEELRAKVSPETKDPQSEAVKEQLKSLGFITKEEQQAEMRRKEQDQAVQTELNKLENTYDGKDGRPKFDRNEVIEFAISKQIGDLEAAYERMHREELIDWHVKQALSKTQGVKTETSDGSGSQETGTTSADLREAAMKGDRNALKTFLKRQFT